MSDAPQRGMFGPIAIAAVLSLVVTLVRLYGELHDWDPTFFGKSAGGGGAVLGISWLVVPFGFWFGRRLAKGGHRPASTGRAIGCCVLGFALMMGLFIASQKLRFLPEGKVGVSILMGAAVALGLLAAVAWPAGWLTLATYGILARLPVAVVQYMAFQSDDPAWTRTHYHQGPPPPAPQDPDFALFALTLAQLTVWPFAFTVLVGGLFAAIGAATVRK